MQEYYVHDRKTYGISINEFTQMNDLFTGINIENIIL